MTVTCIHERPLAPHAAPLAPEACRPAYPPGVVPVMLVLLYHCSGWFEGVAPGVPRAKFTSTVSLAFVWSRRVSDGAEEFGTFLVKLIRVGLESYLVELAVLNVVAGLLAGKQAQVLGVSERFPLGLQRLDSLLVDGL